MGQNRMFGRKDKGDRRASEGRGFDSFELRLGDEMRGERATMGKSLVDVQRELRIKASYINAIENADLTEFDSLSFVAGYVRSYARYLDMDPEEVFARFCMESGFGGINALTPMESQVAKSDVGGVAAPRTKSVDPVLGNGNPFTKKATPVFAGFEPGALGSLAVLALLIGGLGYGGWTIVQEIQRVQVTPVEEAPELLAELDPLDGALPDDTPQANGAIATDEREDALARLYRPRALDAPVLSPRDAPISTITPGTVGALASAVPSTPFTPEPAAPRLPVDAALLQAAADAAVAGTESPRLEDAPQVLADAPDTVMLFAVRPAWVRVRAASGDVLFEKILEPGETYEVPAADLPPTLHAGNSGAVYLSLGGKTYGPVGEGASVTRDVALAADALTGRYDVAVVEEDRDLARVVAELAQTTRATADALE
ncbi:MAG: helix-turn-helix domain-containing protein [Pseudomonadota bacterium]